MNRGKFSLSVVLVSSLTVLLVACGSAGPGTLTPEEVETMKTTVDQMDQRITENSDQLEALEGTVNNQKNRVETLSETTAQVEDRLTLVESRMDFIDSTKFEMLSRLEKLESTVMATPDEKLSGKAGKSQTPLSDSEYQEVYQNAYSTYQSGDYQQAISQFSRVIEARSGGDLSDNAQYWIGECYYGLKNYTRAIVEFEKVFTFKDSNKDDDAQLKLGLCYLNIGQNDKARDEFQRLVDFYPESEYKSTAVKYLNQL